MIPNILTSVSGLPKSGKTHLAMTWPEPIKIFSFDLGADYVMTKFPDKAIDIHNFTLPIIETDTPAPYAEKVWDEFQDEYKKDVYGGEYQTLVLDTATVVWAILRQAITEAKNRKKLLEVEYALPNLKMSALFAHARQAGINLVTTQYLRDRYVAGENTGELEVDGWKNTIGQSDLILEMAVKNKADKSVMIATIKSNRFDRDLNGKSFEDTTYDELVALMFGE